MASWLRERAQALPVPGQGLRPPRLLVAGDASHRATFFVPSISLTPRRVCSCRGKSTLLNMMAMGTSIQTVPTVGLSVKTMKHAGVSMKVRARPGRRRLCE